MTLETMDAYGATFICKTNALLLTNRQFLERNLIGINPDDFNNPSHKWIVQKALEYYDRYHLTVSREWLFAELKEKVAQSRDTKAADAFYAATVETLKASYEFAKAGVEPGIADKFVNFCRDRAMERFLITSADLMVTGDFEAIWSLSKEVQRVGNQQRVGHSYETDVNVRMQDDVRSIIPYPFHHWNDISDGGMHGGDLILTLGGLGSGKSWLEVAKAAYVKSLGYNVLYYSLELEEDYVGKRFDAHYLGVPVNQVKRYRNNLDDLLQQQKGKMIIKRLKRKEKTFAYIESHTNWLISEGFQPHYICIDYLDVLKMSANDRQLGTKELYEDIRDWGSDLDVPICSPVQVNRGGLKLDVVEADNVAGFMEKLHVADTWVSLSRTKEDKKIKQCRIHYGKNRYGDDGHTEVFAFEPSHGDFKYLREYVEDEEEPSEPKAKYTNEKTKGIIRNSFESTRNGVLLLD